MGWLWNTPIRSHSLSSQYGSTSWLIFRMIQLPEASNFQTQSYGWQYIPSYPYYCWFNRIVFGKKTHLLNPWLNLPAVSVRWNRRGGNDGSCLERWKMGPKMRISAKIWKSQWETWWQTIGFWGNIQTNPFGWNWNWNQVTLRFPRRKIRLSRYRSSICCLCWCRS